MSGHLDLVVGAVGGRLRLPNLLLVVGVGDGGLVVLGRSGRVQEEALRSRLVADGLDGTLVRVWVRRAGVLFERIGRAARSLGSRGPAFTGAASKARAL